MEIRKPCANLEHPTIFLVMHRRRSSTHTAVLFCGRNICRWMLAHRPIVLLMATHLKDMHRVCAVAGASSARRKPPIMNSCPLSTSSAYVSQGA